MLHSRGHLLAYNAYPAKLRRSCNLQLNASPMLSQWALRRVWLEKLPRERAANVSIHCRGDGPQKKLRFQVGGALQFRATCNIILYRLNMGNREGQSQARQRQRYDRNCARGRTIVGCRGRVNCMVRATMQFSHDTWNSCNSAKSGCISTKLGQVRRFEGRSIGDGASVLGQCHAALQSALATFPRYLKQL